MLSEPIFRYVVVLLVAVVLIRIMLGLSGSMRQDKSSQAGEDLTQTSATANAQKPEEEPVLQSHEAPDESQKGGPEHE